MRPRIWIYFALICLATYISVAVVKKMKKNSLTEQTPFFVETVANYYSPDEIQVIFDIGSRDAMQSVEMAKKYPHAKIYAFECNPQTLPLCYSNVKDYPNIVIVPKAVNSYSGKCSFYAIDPERTETTWKDGNPGASSLFEANGSYDHIEKYVQNKIEVDCVRLDDFCKSENIERVDLVWMDLQGAELLALQSMGDYLHGVKLIHTELEINSMYKDQSLFKDVHPHLKDHGFFRLSGNTQAQFGADFIYLNAIELDKKMGIASSKEELDSIDVVIPTCDKDSATLELCIEGVKKHVAGVRRIIVISDERCTESAEWFDEKKFPFSLAQIQETFKGQSQERTGWYFQQLLKLYASMTIPEISANVLVVDSDTIFLSGLQFLDFKDTALYNPGSEFHKPYFKHMERLLPGLEKQFKAYSGISHHLLFQRHFLYDLFQRVEKIHQKPFWKAFIECVDEKEILRSGASEYEIYFNFLFQYYPHICKLRELKWKNVKEVGDLEIFREEGYDYITCHAYLRDQK